MPTGSSSTNELMQAIREACSPKTWSKAVEITRKDSVTGDTNDSPNEELVLRVAGERSIHYIVRLFPNDLDWLCSCVSDDDPCAHIAAAIIALKRAEEQGLKLPRSSHSAARIRYQFIRVKNQLQLERWIDDEGVRSPLIVSLTALNSGRIKGPSIIPTQDDLAIELALQGSLNTPIAAKAIPGLLQALQSLEQNESSLLLDGQSIRVSTQPVGLVCRIEDEGPGVRIFAKQDESIQELFANGVALTLSQSDNKQISSAQVLRPVLVPQLDPLEVDMLRQGRFFGRQEFPQLVAEILPALEKKIATENRSRQLPQATTSKLSINIQTYESTPGTLSLVPRIHYGLPGDAGHAILEHGRLVPHGSSIPIRQLAQETELRRSLKQRFSLDMDTTASFSNAEAVHILEQMQAWQHAGHGRLSGDGVKLFAHKSPLKAHVQVTDSGLQLSFVSDNNSASAEASCADANRVLQAWRQGDSLVRLLDGGYAALPQQWLAKHGERLSEFVAARLDKQLDQQSELAIDLPKALLPGLADFAEDLALKLPTSLQNLRDKLQDESVLDNTNLPDDLRADLRPYQRSGVQRLMQLQNLELGALLADDMGLGKTLQAICLLKSPSLIVVPTSVAQNWLSEIKKFRPRLKASLFHGTTRRLDLHADVVITTYALLRLERQQLAAQDWQVLVLDEAQNIKNSASQAAKAAYTIPAKFRLCLSGTPVENRLEDLWSQMHCLNPGLLGSPSEFHERYARPIAAGDQQAALQLRKRTKPFILRRMKADVAKDLPPRTDTVLYVELTAEERLQYETILASTRADVMRQLGQGGNVMEALEALLRLRQACCHTGLVPGSNDHRSAKLALLVEKLQEIIAEGHKALVFSQWTSLLDLLEPALACADLKYLRLDGSTQDRQSIVDSFQASAGPPILIMSLKAGGVGLNLTAADHVFILDPWWNPAAEDQAADRAHRIGQERPVLVHKLVALNTVEEKIIQLQVSKRALAAAVHDPQSLQGSLSLSREELLNLFES